MSKCICIITARGGSKRIPRKNIRNFLGKPIIQYSIGAALGAKCFDDVMVSTDDTEIANLSKSIGANIPFMRSADTSGDYSTTAEVMLEVLDSYQKIGKKFDYCCCIYPTAPFVTTERLENAFDLLVNNNAKSVVPIVRFGFPIWRSFKIEDEKVKMNWPEHIATRSQDLPPAFHDCGQFYFIKVDDFVKEKKLFTDNTLSIEIPESEVQDIDNLEDWRIAEIKYTFLLEKQKAHL